MISHPGLARYDPDLDNTAPTTQPLACPRCGALDTPTLGPGAGPHYASARCQHCGAVVRWLSRYTPTERQARRQQARQAAMSARPPSQAQLSYLAVLGDNGPPPETMLEAHQRIDARKRGEVGR
jgi:hypothetical protein